MSDESVLAHGGDIFLKMLPTFIKDHNIPKPTNKEMQYLWEVYTHFLEEVSLRGLDMKKFFHMWTRP